MAAKLSIRARPQALQTAEISRSKLDRRPTEAERAYVRAKARQAARAVFEADLHHESAASEDEATCE